MTQHDVHRVRIADLRRLRDRYECFADKSDGDLEDLIADMRAKGQRAPIEILGNRTVICGHDQVLAARALGWSHVDAIILANEDEIEQRVLEDNFLRAHLDPLAMARLLNVLKANERDEGPDRRRELEDGIAKRLGRSRRTVQRNLRILKAPPEVQRAVQTGLISRSTAEEVLRRPMADQEKLAADIRAGADPKQAIARLLRERSDSDRVPRKCFRDILSSIRRGLPVLAGRIQEVAGQVLAPDEAIVLLKEWGRVGGKLLKAEQRALAESKKHFPPQ